MLLVVAGRQCFASLVALAMVRYQFCRRSQVAGRDDSTIGC